MPRTIPSPHLSAADFPVVRWMLILRPTIVTATLGVAMLILPGGTIDKFPLAVVVFGTYILSLLYWMTQSISGLSRPLLATQIAFDIFIVTIIIHYTGGYDSSFVGFYFLSIMCASLFFRRLVTVFFAVQAAVFYILYLLFLTRMFGSPFIDTAARQSIMLQAILYSLLMLAVAFLSSYYSERLVRKDSALSHALRLLKEARLDTSDILQSMNNGLIAFDRTGRIMYFNNAALRVLGVERIGWGERYDTVLGERAAVFAQIVGRELDTEPSVADEEFEIEDPDGNLMPIGLTTVPLFDNDGGRRGLIVNFKDISEKHKLIEMIRQSDRMAAIGELSAAIAHEIRNPLASIGSAVELLAEDIDDTNERVTRLLKVIIKESDRLQRLSTEFLNFARMKPPDSQPVDLRKTVDEVVALVDNDPRKTDTVMIKNKIPAGPLVRFDPDHLKQLVINVVINSLDAIGGGGAIDISLERKRKSNEGFTRIVISDDGPGFPADSLKSVFEPFYSTKKEGTGLGLALVRKMAVSNHGRVFARNRAAGGAEIVLDIPLDGAEHG